MINMYSMMGGGMYGLGSMNTQGQGINVHQQLKQRYGVGYEDFGSNPYVQPYPMAIIPRRQETPCEKNPIYDFLKKCFS